jgi:hypothetical protein
MRRATGRLRGGEAVTHRAAVLGAVAAGALVAAAAAGCGGEAGDLLAVERSGSIPGARLDLRVTVDGRAACNRGALRQLPSDQVIAARRIERALAGEEDDPGPAARDLRLRPGPRSILRYRARVEAGTVAFADTSRGQPAAFFEVAKLARDVARGTCGLRR